MLGCAAHELQAIPPTRGSREIAALIDGQTTRDRVVEQWGEPSSTFEDGRILSYRLDGRFEVVRLVERRSDAGSRSDSPSRWTNAVYDLVLAFDSAGVLETHRLLRIR